MKILLPVDLVHPVSPSLSMLKTMVNLRQADIKLLYVREILPAYEHMMKNIGSFADDWDNQLNAKAREIFKDIEEKMQGHCRSVSSEITAGPVAMMIGQMAKDEGYAVTVLTPGRHGVAERLFAGSVTARCVAHVPGTVIVARPRAEEPSNFKKVIFGFDGSHNAREAIERALVQFSLIESDVEVIVVHSVDMVEPVKLLTPIEFVSAVEQNMLMQGQTLIAEAEKILKLAGVKKLNCMLVEGDPALQLASIAQDVSADLMIIGAHGHSAVERFLLGSVSERVAMHAPCSVAVIKPEKVSTSR